MDQAEIERVHAEFWKPGWRSVTPGEVACFQETIREHRPESFIEIGTASGLSGGMICRLLEENGGRRFTTVDRLRTFFGDETKETGFLLPMVYQGSSVAVTRLTGRTALDVPGLGQTFDMGFVDAAHSHPWPLLDTLCLFPVLTGSRVLFHHDLDLYRKQTDKITGIGPKYLFDQFPDSHRHRYETNDGNLFRISLDMPVSRVEQIALDAFSLPWSLHQAMPDKRLRAVRAILREHYDPAVVARFDECAAKFNKPV